MIAGEVQDRLPGLVTAPSLSSAFLQGARGTSIPDDSGRSCRCAPDDSWMTFAKLLGDPRPASVIDGLGVLSMPSPVIDTHPDVVGVMVTKSAGLDAGGPVPAARRQSNPGRLASSKSTPPRGGQFAPPLADTE